MHKNHETRSKYILICGVFHQEHFIQNGMDAWENVNLRPTVCATNTSTATISTAITPYYLCKLQWSPLPRRRGVVCSINHGQLTTEAEWRLGGGWKTFGSSQCRPDEQGAITIYRYVTSDRFLFFAF